MGTVSKILLVLVALSFLALFSFASLLQYTQTEEELDIQRKILKIQEEAHIDNIYTVYQNNIATCRRQALETGKDQVFINVNCITPVNQSIIGQWLQDRGYGDLLEEVK